MRNLLLLSLFLIGCKEGSGIIETDYCKTHITNCEITYTDGENGGPKNGDPSIPTVDSAESYSNYEFQQMIDAAPGFLDLDKNVEIDNNIIISNPIEITSSSNKKIIMKNFGYFELKTNNFKLSSVEIVKRGCFDFIKGDRDLGNNLIYTGLILEDLYIELNDLGCLNIDANGTSISKTTIISKNIFNRESPLLKLNGDNLLINSSLILDNDKHSDGILIYESNNISIKNSVINGSSSEDYLSGAITFEDSSNITLSNNRIQDTNNSKIIAINDPLNQLNGSSAISIESVTNLSTNLISGFSADRFLLDDRNIGGNSSGIVIPTQQIISNFSNSSILNQDGRVVCGSLGFFSQEDSLNDMNRHNSNFYAGSAFKGNTCP